MIPFLFEFSKRFTLYVADYVCIHILTASKFFGAQSSSVIFDGVSPRKASSCSCLTPLCMHMFVCARMCMASRYQT